MNQTHCRVLHPLLDDYYLQVSNTIGKLSPQGLIRRKSVHMYAASGINDVDSYVRRALGDFLSSSKETSFSECVYKPFVQGIVTNTVPIQAGVDAILPRNGQTVAYIVRSGPHVLNTSTRRSLDDFAKQILRNRSINEVCVGYSYGVCPVRKSSLSFREIAGLHFWAELTGQPNYAGDLLSEISAYTQRSTQNPSALQNSFIQLATTWLTNNGAVNANGTLNWSQMSLLNGL